MKTKLELGWIKSSEDCLIVSIKIKIQSIGTLKITKYKHRNTIKKKD